MEECVLLTSPFLISHVTKFSKVFVFKLCYVIIEDNIVYIINETQHYNNPTLAQLVERKTVVVAVIFRSLVRFRQVGFFILFCMLMTK